MLKIDNLIFKDVGKYWHVWHQRDNGKTVYLGIVYPDSDNPTEQQLIESFQELRVI